MRDPLRVVQVIPSLVVGGAEAFAVALAQAQLDAGHDVRLLVLKHTGPLEDRLGPHLLGRTTVLGKRPGIDPSVLPRLVRWLARVAPDVVHTHLFTSLAWAGVAATLVGVPRLVHTQHAVHDDAIRWLPHVRRGLGTLVDVVVGCNETTAQDVVDRGYAPADRVVAIDNGIDLRGRPRAPLDGDPPVIGTVGRLVPIKGQRFLIDALARLAATESNVRGVLFGEGPEADALAQQIADHRLSDRIALPGRVDDVPDRLAGLDVFVLPSLSEAMPLAALEAAAAGLPMVVTSGGGAKALIEAGAGGLVVPPGDDEALAEALRELLDLPPEARRALGEASHATALTHYDLDATRRAYDRVYGGDLSGRTAGARTT